MPKVLRKKCKKLSSHFFSRFFENESIMLTSGFSESIFQTSFAESKNGHL
jgi:hypothetical protein